jgi:hypothetical protein
MVAIHKRKFRLTNFWTIDQETLLIMLMDTLVLCIDMLTIAYIKKFIEL